MTSADRIKLEDSWKHVLRSEFTAPYMSRLKEFLVSEYGASKTIYPKGDQYFAALNHTPFAAFKVVILGQDPYHGTGQAHGLCFSVLPPVPPPPSLVNIYEELRRDVGFRPPGHGCLTAWTRQGVLLLNSVLTVEHGRAASHQKRGWETFTDSIIKHLAEEREHIAFMLWGAYAQRKGEHIDRSRHLVLAAPHPSPLSATRGFFGCRHFSQANAYLSQHGLEPVDWQLPEQPVLHS